MSDKSCDSCEHKRLHYANHYCRGCLEHVPYTSWELKKSMRSCGTCKWWSKLGGCSSEKCVLQDNWQPKHSPPTDEQVIDPDQLRETMIKMKPIMDEEEAKGTGYYIAGWWCEDSQLWLPFQSCGIQTVKRLVEHWIAVADDLLEPAVVCQYMMNPHCLQPVEEEKGTPGQSAIELLKRIGNGEEWSAIEIPNVIEALEAQAPQTEQDLEEALGLLVRAQHCIGGLGLPKYADVEAIEDFLSRFEK
jgi:hypothetical protein